MLPDNSMADAERWAAGMRVPAYAIDDQTAIKVIDGAVEVVSEGHWKMYGLIGKMIAVAGQRDALLAILFDGVTDMSGCLSYVVAKDPADENALWITEVWDSQSIH